MSHAFEAALISIKLDSGNGSAYLSNVKPAHRSRFGHGKGNSFIWYIYFIGGLFNSQEKLVVDKIFILAHQIAHRLGMIF